MKGKEGENGGEFYYFDLSNDVFRFNEVSWAFFMDAAEDECD